MKPLENISELINDYYKYMTEKLIIMIIFSYMALVHQHQMRQWQYSMKRL